MEHHESYEAQLKQAQRALESTILELDYYARKGNARIIHTLRPGDLVVRPRNFWMPLYMPHKIKVI